MGKGTNEICMKCETAFNAINGRYCKKLNCYVEYAAAPVCKKDESNQKL